MKIIAIRDEKSGKIWAITNKIERDEEEFYNTQFIGSSKPIIVSVRFKDKKERNRLIMGENDIQVSGWEPITELGNNRDKCYIVNGDSAVPKAVAEGKKNLTLNEALEGLGLSMVIQDLVQCGLMHGLPKEVEYNIDDEECRKNLENEYNTKIMILNVVKPDEIRFHENANLSNISDSLIEKVKVIEKIGNEAGENVSSEEMSNKEQKVIDIANQLKALADELGIDPKELLR